MYQLNLPSYQIKISGTQTHPTIFDILRGKYVSLTPEEWVRQHFIHFLISQKDYPKMLLANEVPLSIGNKNLRADSVLYDNELKLPQFPSLKKYSTKLQSIICFYMWTISS